MSVINPFKKLSLGPSVSQSRFYCSQDLEELEESEHDIEELLKSEALLKNNNYVKSASSSNLHQFETMGGCNGSDSGIGSHKELSRSLDCLDPLPSNSGDLGLSTERERRKSQTLPSFPSPNLRQFKKLSLGSAFGTKHLGLGRKFSSLLTAPTER